MYKLDCHISNILWKRLFELTELIVKIAPHQLKYVQIFDKHLISDPSWQSQYTLNLSHSVVISVSLEKIFFME